jgi:hypothetical protein
MRIILMFHDRPGPGRRGAYVARTLALLACIAWNSGISAPNHAHDIGVLIARALSGILARAIHASSTRPRRVLTACAARIACR